MTKNKLNSVLALVSCLVFILAVFSVPSFAQEKEETEKLLKEVAGDYEFEYEGQIIVFVFSVENGNLMGAPEGESPEGRIYCGRSTSQSGERGMKQEN